MRRVRTLIALILALAVIAGVIWLISEVKIEIRLEPYGEGPVADPVPADPVLRWVGWGLGAVAGAAVLFTAWAVVKQVLLIRRGRADSR
ncbi:MAG: hypothetical protein KKA16_03035 [Alphaproteobacteria bacterium]|nr:hypothetical protein [Alphaproteobacteria bacterium]MBU2378503.1 hypothetical protein [Alphaproteobacteria bacterium]